jgi:CRISPR/Cas system Type II protein with McrA/HNH and RuvC-like nuclease domain
MGKSMQKYLTKDERIKARRLLMREAYARYSARKKFQTPIDEDLLAIKQFYLKCPDGYEVDHIIPISRKGLHSLSNLQYLTKSNNKRKWAKLNWCPEGDLNA